MRRHKPRISRFMAGAIGVLVIGIACYFVFGGSLPFQRGAVPTQGGVHDRDRTAHSVARPGGRRRRWRGHVGQPGRRADSQAAVITMSINPNGLPIHADATAKVRPRIFLEGNFYVDLHPGTPDSPDLSSGATLSVSRTSGPVQLDRVLSALNSNSRANLETPPRGYGAALDAPPIPAQDASQDPLVRGQTGGQSLNTALNYSVDAFKASAMVNQALLGLRPNDLSGVVAAMRAFSGRSRRAATSSRASSARSTPRWPRSPPASPSSRRRSLCCRRSSSARRPPIRRLTRRLDRRRHSLARSCRASASSARRSMRHPMDRAVERADVAAGARGPREVPDPGGPEHRRSAQVDDRR